MNAPSKILAVRVGRGGDLAMVTPALDALLAAFPSAELHLLTSGDGPRFLGDFHPALTRCLIYTRRWPRSWTMKRTLGREIAAARYDRIYVFEEKPAYRRWLGAAAPEVFVLSDVPAGRHYSDRCLDLVAESVDRPIERGWLRLPVRDDGVERARALLADNDLDPDGPLVGLHVTFSGTRLPWLRDRGERRHRMWPAGHFACLAKLLDGTARVLIDALPEEAELAEAIVRDSGGAITLLSAPPDFQRYKGLLTQLDVLVTANTGPMHVAAALGTPVVALFSRWDPGECGPFMDPGRKRILRAEETKDPGGGLAAITPEAVRNAAVDLLRMETS